MYILGPGGAIVPTRIPFEREILSNCSNSSNSQISISKICKITTLIGSTSFVNYNKPTPTHSTVGK